MVEMIWMHFSHILNSGPNPGRLGLGPRPTRGSVIGMVRAGETPHPWEASAAAMLAAAEAAEAAERTLLVV